MTIDCPMRPRPWMRSTSSTTPTKPARGSPPWAIRPARSDEKAWMWASTTATVESCSALGRGEVRRPPRLAAPVVQPDVADPRRLGAGQQRVAVAVCRRLERRSRELGRTRLEAAVPLARRPGHVPVAGGVGAGEVEALPAVPGVKTSVATLGRAIPGARPGLVLGPAPDQGGQARVLRDELVHADDVDPASDHRRGDSGRDVLGPSQHRREPGAVLEVAAERGVLLAGGLVVGTGGGVVARTAALVPQRGPLVDPRSPLPG